MPPIVRKTILLIEDEEATATALTPLLQGAGFEVALAKNGVDGLTQAEALHPDLVILDLLLPGLPGIDVLATLKKNEATRTIPVLILSQLSDQDSISRGIALGAMGYLVKSEYQLEDIVKKVKDILK